MLGKPMVSRSYERTQVSPEAQDETTHTFVAVSGRTRTQCSCMASQSMVLRI